MVRCLSTEPMLPFCQLDHQEHISIKFYSKDKHFYSWKCIKYFCPQNVDHFNLIMLRNIRLNTQFIPSVPRHHWIQSLFTINKTSKFHVDSHKILRYTEAWSKWIAWSRKKLSNVFQDFIILFWLQFHWSVFLWVHNSTLVWIMAFTPIRAWRY